MQGTQYATKRSILCRGAFCGPTTHTCSLSNKQKDFSKIYLPNKTNRRQDCQRLFDCICSSKKESKLNMNNLLKSNIQI